MEATNTTAAAVHPFERAGLGKGPFRCIGSYESKFQACHGAPIQPGTSCDYCGQGIMTAFKIKSADGNQFKVGCDCVAKTYRECAKTEAERDARQMVDAVNKLKTAAANARKDEVIKAAHSRMLLADGILMMIEIEVAGRKRNALEYLSWMFKNGGRTGKLKAAKLTDKLLAGGQ